MKIEKMIEKLKEIQLKHPGIEVYGASTIAPCEHYGTAPIERISIDTNIADNSMIVMLETNE
jgi:hypothetical protein